jgi:hypothetical protein
MNSDPEAERAFRLLLGDSSVGSSVSVSSTLRRAIATGAVVLQDRVNRLDEQMLISSDLQV